MTYSIRPVTNNFSANYVQGSGFPPAGYRYLLFSVWVELSTSGPGWQGFAFGNNVVLDSAQDSTRGIQASISAIDPMAGPGLINYVLGNGNSYSIGAGAYEDFGKGGFITPTLVANHYYNILISVDSVANVIQCYLDDAPLSLDPGSIWHAATNIAEPFSTDFTSPGTMFNGFLGLAGDPNFGTPLPCMADFFLGVPPSFFDLSITANRRKFINADLSPVDLGDDASSVFGTPPQIYCTVRPDDGGAPAFQLNRGIVGGIFTGSPGSAEFCSPPPPVVPILSCGPHGLTYITPTWVFSGDVDTYTLQYRKVGTTDWTVITGILDTAYEIKDLPLGTCYELEVAAVFDSVQGDFSTIQTCCTNTQITMADLWFGSTGSFVDLTVEANRRKFISADGGAQNLGGNGSVPFGTPPAVFLTNTGVPNTFALNNGVGGAFRISSDVLHKGASNPKGTSTDVITTQDNTLNHGVLGDYRNGRIYAFNKATLTDNGTPRKWLRRWRALPQATNHAVKFNWLAVGVETGQGVPPGTNPQLVLRWSDDGGDTWSHERFLPVGRTGKTTQIIKFNRLGMTRRYGGSDRIYELSSTDPFRVAIMDAETEAV